MKSIGHQIPTAKTAAMTKRPSPRARDIPIPAAVAATPVYIGLSVGIETTVTLLTSVVSVPTLLTPEGPAALLFGKVEEEDGDGGEVDGDAAADPPPGTANMLEGIAW